MFEIPAGALAAEIKRNHPKNQEVKSEKISVQRRAQWQFAFADI
jgi:hypothetical protein